MKQTFALFFFGIILILGIVYFFFPSNQNVVVSVSCQALKSAVNRTFASPALRNKWLPKEGKQLNENEFFYDGCTITFSSDFFQTNSVSVLYNSLKASSLLTTSSAGDTTSLILNFIFADSAHFFKRVPLYFSKKHLRKVTQKLLQSLASFVSTSENIYGTAMHQTQVKDTTLISLKGNSVSYPNVSEIYKNIEILQNFAILNSALQTNPPMLHILKNSDKDYLFMVALPVNKWIETSGNIVSKRMLPGGNMLESGEVKGGFYTVDNYLKELENFKRDLNSISPAIPYQSLITDRIKETDSSKWITKLYYPVF